MSHTICDGYSREAHINQQTDMAMSDSMDPYSFHTAGSAATAYFVMQIGFRKWEYAVNFVELQRVYIRLNFIGVKVRYEDTADTFFCFRRGDDILAIYPLERLCNMNDFPLKIEVSWC